MEDWGPSHQQPRSGITDAKKLIGGACFLIAMVSPLVFHLVIWAGVFYGGVRINRRFRVVPQVRALLTGKAAGPASEEPSASPSAVFLGVDQTGRSRWSRAGRAVLVIGPSQSGKTTGVIIPTLLDYSGPVVSTSTKPDVLRTTMRSRSVRGRVWQFDPTGHAQEIPGVWTLRWSPLSCSKDWDGALLMARAMVDGSGAGAGTTDGTHWVKRAQALLAGLLHAAAVGGRDMTTVVGWVAAHEIDEPGAILEQAGEESRLAVMSLLGVANVERRERASIFSATADALDAYTSTSALAAAQDQNFDAHAFVRCSDTMYIHAPAESQRMAAPLVCGLLAEIRRATYHAHATGHLIGRVLFALDEVANVAPITELPQIASEGGGQGLLLLAVLQDLSQARTRWGTQADGFLTLFGTKLILPGVADQRTLETVSTALGEYDRKVVTETRANVPGRVMPQRSHSSSTQRTRVLSPGEVANIPAGHGLHLDGVRWELVTLTPAFGIGPRHTATPGRSR
jgi:type IV secretory pathway TraG/TraD family ATPase VirD4